MTPEQELRLLKLQIVALYDALTSKGLLLERELEIIKLSIYDTAKKLGINEKTAREYLDID